MSIFRRSPRTSGKHCADAFDGEPSRPLAPVAPEAPAGARPPAPRPPWDQAVTWKRPPPPVSPANLARLYRISRVPEHVRALPVPPAPVAPCSGVSALMVGGVEYPSPAPGAADRSYGPVLRHVGAATGTSTAYEHDSAWRLALETGAAS